MMTRRLRRSRLLLGRRSVVRGTLFLSLVFGHMSGEVAHATTFTWNVGSGDWFTAANWTPGGGPPGPTDDAVINNGGTVTLNSPGATITNLTFTSSTLDGNGDLQVDGVMTWSGSFGVAGVIGGSGTITLNGGLTVNNTAFSSNKIMNGRTLTLAGGSATFTGSNGTSTGIDVNSPAAIINNATWEFVGDGGGSQPINGSGAVTNNGTLRKHTRNTGSTSFSATFNNTGSVESLSGTLSISGGTSSGGASYSVASGATLTFAGSGHSLAASSSITGAGTARFTGSTTTMAGTYNV